MDIYATEGHKVICVNVDVGTAKWGDCTDPTGLLEVDKEYTVDESEVHSWHTKVYLKEVEGEFNSAHFRDADATEDEDVETDELRQVGFYMEDYEGGISMYTYTGPDCFCTDMDGFPSGKRHQDTAENLLARGYKPMYIRQEK